MLAYKRLKFRNWNKLSYFEKFLGILVCLGYIYRVVDTPPSVCWGMSNLLAKVLSNRLKVVFHQLIFESKNAFVGCRKILDLVLIENECLVSFANLALKKHTIMYFGRLYLMERMGFGGNWRGSMGACISSPFFSLSERSPYGCFSKSRGLPQGDLLSPMLFWWWRFWVGLLRTGEGGFILGFRVGYTADLGLCVSLIYYLLMMQSFYFIY